jgi:hypothetical protein
LTENLARTFPRILESHEVFSHFTRILSEARNKVVLVSPFITIGLLRESLIQIHESVHVTLITRWSAQEIVGGFNDLQVKTLLDERGNSELRLLWNLHAKYYRGDSAVILGSGNLTRNGLNYRNAGNSEVMIEAGLDLSGLQQLEQRLISSSAIPTEVMYEELCSEVDRLKQLNQSNGAFVTADTPSDVILDDRAWRPHSLMPDNVFDVYRGRINAMDKHVIFSASEDLDYLEAPPGLTKDDFHRFVRNVLAQSPLFPKVLSELEKQAIPTDVGVGLVREVFEDLSNDEAEEVWFALKRWLLHFFSNDFSLHDE